MTLRLLQELFSGGDAQAAGAAETAPKSVWEDREYWQYKIKKGDFAISRKISNFVLPMSKHLILAQRYVISTMRANGATMPAIADELNRLAAEAAIAKGELLPATEISVSTISRELKRNRTKRGRYNPETAQEYANERKERIVRNTALKPGVLKKAMELLKEKRWSPEQISGYLKTKGMNISHERIYQEIRKNPELKQYCHHKMKYCRHKVKVPKAAGKSLIPNRVSIHERPPEADGTRFGDWEMDLVIGAGQKSQILTIVERSQNMFMQAKLDSKRPEEVADKVIALLIPFKKWVHTITTDNGIEFRDHERIAKALGCKVYFADPYCSGQKGAVENANKIFRQYFPKGTDFRNVTQEELNEAQYEINQRPRKKLKFSTPKIEFYKRIC